MQYEENCNINKAEHIRKNDNRGRRYKHRTKRKFPPKYIRINSKQMNRC